MVNKMIHVLKELPRWFSDVVDGRKSFEVRRADRDFKVNDLLALNEYDAEAQEYTGESCLVYIDYILDDPEYVREGYVILGIKPCAVMRSESPYNPVIQRNDYRVQVIGRGEER